MTLDIKLQAEIELKHIQLELSCGRANHFRHFIDQYFCYANGYVSSNGNAAWGKIVGQEYVSPKAKEIIDQPGYDHTLIVGKEHVVPLKVIGQMLLGLECPELEDIKNLIDNWLIFATITKDEESDLDSNGLKQKMPEGFYTKSSHLYLDKFARYKEAGIDLLYPNKA